MRVQLSVLLLCGCVWAGNVLGQPAVKPRDVPLDTRYLRDHAATRGFMLGRPLKARPTPDGKAVLFLRSEPRQPTLRLYEFDLASRKTRELLTPEQVLRGAEEKLSPEEKARRERMRVSVGGFTDFQLSDDGQQVLLSLSGRLFLLNRATAAVRELNTGPGPLLDPRFAPNGKQVAYVRTYDVFVYDLETDRERRLTHGGSATKTHGLAEFVAQEEMHRYSGYWWAPDSMSIVYEEAEADGVEVWYVADPARPEQAPHPSFYPRPGRENVKVRLGIIAVPRADAKKSGPTPSTRETVWIDWDSRTYPYLAQVRWSRGAPLTLLVQNRLQTELVLLKADPASGRTEVLLVEKDPAWVNLRTDVPRWLPDGAGFLWVSESAGGPQLELRDPTGQLQRVLVGPKEGFQRLIDVDAGKGEFVYQASVEPTQARVLAGRLDGKPPIALVLDDGPVQQDAVFAKNHQVYVLTQTSPTRLPASWVHDRSGKVGELPTVAEEPGFVPRVEFVKVGAEPGYHAAIVRPHNFDPQKKYPVIVDVYGGPGHLHVVSAMRNWLLPQWLADQGFLVVAIDNRGTPGRGRDWERAISRKFHSVPLDDQVAGLKALGQRFPEMDLDRVGIVGWSYGGYLSALAVLRRPDVFKAAVAGAPVTDWLDYDTHYTERYLGLPETDPEAYRQASLLTWAGELKRPLLLVHGTADDNVYFRHTLKLADALFRHGKDFDVLPLPSLTHMVPDPLVMEQLWSRIARYFQKHLG